MSLPSNAMEGTEWPDLIDEQLFAVYNAFLSASNNGKLPQGFLSVAAGASIADVSGRNNGNSKRLGHAADDLEEAVCSAILLAQQFTDVTRVYRYRIPV